MELVLPAALELLDAKQILAADVLGFVLGKFSDLRQQLD